MSGEELAVKRQPLSAITVSVSSGTTITRNNHGRNPLYGSTGQIGKTDRTEFDGPSILVARVGANAGSVYAVDGSYGVTDNTLVVRLKAGHSVRYVTELLKHAKLNRMVYGSGQPLVTGTMVKHLNIPTITVDEQVHIAKALHDADDLIATLERLITKKHSIKQGVMQQLLTGRTRLPGFNDPWHGVQLGDHVSYVKTVALSRAQLDTTSALRYLHYGDIHTRKSVRLNAATEDMPRASHLLAGSAGVLRVGDLVFADASEDPAGVGKSVEIMSVPDGGVVPGLHTIAARFNKSVLADGFKAYLQFMPTFRESLLRLAAGTKVLATTRSYISSISISLPQADEQRAIAQVLLDADEEIERLQSRLAKANAIKQGMMQQLLTGRVKLSAGAVS